MNDVRFEYPGKKELAIQVPELVIESGQHIAIVGPSGAGKTTLVDLLLGVITPTHGTITISGRDPVSAVREWPGAISYVPQDVVIARGSLQENIALGYDPSEIDMVRLAEAINKAELGELEQQLRDKSQNSLGEMGSRISGGQRQRVGIARALYTNPKLLVLDEATSSLDAETEKLISDSLATRSKSTTLITIAHRLSTVRSADKVIYISKGQIRAIGSFDEVRKSVPDFDNQANLMGLK